MKKVILSLFLFLTLSAEDTFTEDMFNSLQEDMLKYQEIATNTKQNVDYMPYVISTLHHKDLVDLGVLSLREAITYIPGVDISVGMAGVQNPIFRGSNPFAMGQSKLIIDGIVVNDTLFGAYNQYLDMPIDLIERIEVVRGPGSLEGGVSAYAGSIHVITKANRDDGENHDNAIFAAFGSNNLKMGGFKAGFVQNDLKVSSDFFYQEHDKTLLAGPDRLSTPRMDAPLWLKNYALGLSLEYDGFYAKGRLSQNDSGVGYGQAFTLSEDTNDYLNVANKMLEIGYVTDIAKDIELKLSLGYLDEQRELQNKVMPAGVMMMFPKGRYFLVDYEEQQLEEKVEVKISSIENHILTIGALARQNKVLDNIAKKTIPMTMTPALTTLAQEDLLSIDKEKSYSLYLEDTINFSEATSFQVGLKFDNYTNMQPQLDTRLALVHRYDDSNIFKLMYTESYRKPSWREQYLVGAGYPNSTLTIKPETVTAYEFAYIKKFLKNTTAKINLFYLQNKNQINAQNATNTFLNINDNNLYGFETEFSASLFRNDELYFNYSYVDGDNVDGALANSAQHMSKLYYIYRPSKAIALSSTLMYTGEKQRILEDTRKSVDDYLLANLGLTYRHKQTDSLISLSIKNLFDESYVLPSPNNTYDDDFIQDGRSFFVRIEKRF